MRRLTHKEIESCASTKGADKTCVRNFLGMIVPEDRSGECKSDLNTDARIYGWDFETKEAIIRGINIADGWSR